MSRTLIKFLSNPDNVFNIVVLCTAPLLALCVIGMLGSGA